MADFIEPGEAPPQGALLKLPLDLSQKVYVVGPRETIEPRLAGGLIPNWFPNPDEGLHLGWAFDNYFHAYAYLLKRKAMKGK